MVLTTSAARRRSSLELPADPLWYKDAVIYEVHVRAFYDANGDGVGDFAGLLQKLDYLTDLGVTAVWLLPFYPSPGRDDGYDIADYLGVNPAYGTLADVRRFIRAAHARGLRVITELVCNHTSDQHPWFQRARRAPAGSPWRNYYVWSETPDRYREARVIFSDFEPSNWSWDPVARAYYWHRFYHHQPDLNFDNPRVVREIFRVVDHWLRLGVDGFRLDAIPYLYEREGTTCESLPETHAFLRALRAHIDARFAERILLAEANQWPEDAAAYFGAGDECQMAFHFPLMPRLFLALRSEDRFPIVDILEQTPPVPAAAQWALFLRNHDELTLEMVTDEERDYLYRVYAADPQARVNLGIRRRLAPLLGNNRRRIELLYGLLFSLPGTPVVYYGDEIGMGDNIYLGDRNAVRTPMQWSAERNAGFSTAPGQRLYLPVVDEGEFGYQAVNVAAQEANPSSLLWWVRRLIALRRRHRVFGRGSLRLVDADNHRVLAFLRSDETETVLVVANLSRYAQPVRLDLAGLAGCQPVELFGAVPFPAVGRDPYPLTLGPHGFLWLALERPAPHEVEEASLPAISWPDGSGSTALGPLTTDTRRQLAEALGRWIDRQPWAAGLGPITGVEVVDLIPAVAEERPVIFVVADVGFREGEMARYLLPMVLRAPTDDVAPGRTIAPLTGPAGPMGTLADGWDDPRVLALLADLARAARPPLRGSEVELAPGPAGDRRGRRPTAARASAGSGGPVVPRPGSEGRWRAHPGWGPVAVAVADGLLLKGYRRLEVGQQPDPELAGWLASGGVVGVAPPVGEVVLRVRDEPATVATLHLLPPNEGDLWSVAVDAAARLLEQAAVGEAGEPPPPASGPREAAADLLTRATVGPPALAHQLSGPFLETARRTGARLAAIHLTLAAASDPDLTPGPLDRHGLRSLYQELRGLAAEARRRLGVVPAAHGALGRAAMDGLARSDVAFRPLLALSEGGRRIRGDDALDLHRIAHTGRDVAFLDFGGDPTRPLGERRLRRSPLADLASLLHSLLAASLAAAERVSGAPATADPWAMEAFRWGAAALVSGYLAAVDGQGLLPTDAGARALLLAAYRWRRALRQLAHPLGSDAAAERAALVVLAGLV